MADGAPHIPETAQTVGYTRTRARVEDYFDRTATQTWERLTSDAPVSRIRQTVREGRDQMRALMLSCLPKDLRGRRILDAGCGAGQMTAELALRGADVIAVDISPSLIGIAEQRLPTDLRHRVQFAAGDMLDPAHGPFDHVLAMDSLIYYTADDIVSALDRLQSRVAGSIVFTVAPRTPLLMAMWYAGQVFPKNDRSPTMIPHSRNRLKSAAFARGTPLRIMSAGRIARGFYFSEAMEVQP